jgi:hypothetical protein
LEEWVRQFKRPRRDKRSACVGVKCGFNAGFDPGFDPGFDAGLMLDLMLLAKAQVVQSRPRVGWRGKRNEAI